MKLSKGDMCLYAITDRSLSSSEDEFYLKVEESLAGGIKILQMREKHLSKDEMVKQAMKLKKLCDKYKAKFIINDFIELAKEVGADGVHLGQEDDTILKAKKILNDSSIIGISAKTVEEAKRAEDEGASYIGVGAVFNTISKNTATISKKLFQDIRAAVSLPIVAIGGINHNNLHLLKEYGIDSIAIISDIYSKESYEIRSYCQKLRSAVEDILR